MSTTSPARLYCTLVGAGLVILGIVGFFYSAGFETGATGVAKDSEDVFGILAVNGWSNALHVALGVLALLAAGSVAAARGYALGFGLLFAVVAIWGFVDGDGIVLGLLPLDNASNVLHLLLGLAGLAAGAASPAAARSSPRA